MAINYDSKFQEMELLCDNCGYDDYADGTRKECEDEAVYHGWVRNGGRDLCSDCAQDESNKEDEEDDHPSFV